MKKPVRICSYSCGVAGSVKSLKPTDHTSIIANFKLNPKTKICMGKAYGERKPLRISQSDILRS